MLATTLQTMAGPAATEGVVQAQTIANLADQHIQLQQQLAEVQQTMAALKVASQLEQRLADFDAHMAAGKLLSWPGEIEAPGQVAMICFKGRPGALRDGLQAVKREASMT